jgi:hypothetical protein
MSLTKWLSAATLMLILVANVLGFMADAGYDVVRTHASVGLVTLAAGLISTVLVLRAK